MHADARPPVALAWQRTVALPPLVFAALALVVLVHHDSYVEMAGIWRRSETFNHGFLVLPLFAYLVWQRRHHLAASDGRVWWPGLVLLALLGLLWLVGQAASALTPSFFAAVALVPALIAVLCGPAALRAFPVGLLVFAVPFGEVFVPTLIDWTADFTVAALRLVGVPVFREGQNLVVPNGQWSVVDACSGIRYLLASAFIGSLYALLMYRSPRRRALFIAASLVVPIVANWVRAFGIVLLGYLTDNTLAAGADHLIYGWVFFGLIIGALFLLGARWREDLVPETVPAVSAGQRAVPLRALLAVAPAAVLLLALPVSAERALEPAAPSAEVPPLQVEPAAGWRAAEGFDSSWRPQLAGARAVRSLQFERGSDRVLVTIGIYRGQRQGQELVNSVNTLLADHLLDRIIERDERRIDQGAAAIDVRTAQMRVGGRDIAAAQWYWLGGDTGISDTGAKLDLAWRRLRGQDDTSAWIAVAAVETRAGSRAPDVVAAFVADMAAPLHQSLAAAAQSWR